MRSIREINPAFKINMGGIILDQALPYKGVDQIDPFLLIHHWADTHKGGRLQKNVGVPPHPHRGFAPVSFVFKGGIHHRDSEGNSDIVEAGGTQWMNSGKGIVHSERPKKELAEHGGDFEIIQFWVNAPAARKGDPPNYQPLSYEDTPFIVSDDNKAKIGLVAGELMDKKGPIDTYSELVILRMEFAAGGKINLPIPNDFNALLYILDGKLDVRDRSVGDKDLVWFNNDSDTIEIKASGETRAILLSGKPINEPLATYGPFVMNTEREIAEAIRDYQSGKMGTLIEKFD